MSIATLVVEERMRGLPRGAQLVSQRRRLGVVAELGALRVALEPRDELELPLERGAPRLELALANGGGARRFEPRVEPRLLGERARARCR